MNATLKVSAVITYSDNSVSQILSYLDENGQISVNDSLGHADAADDVANQMLALNDFSFTYNSNIYNLSASSTGGSDKVATSAVLEISGRVALDDNSWGDFYHLFNSNESSSALSNYGDEYFDSAMNDVVLNARFVATVSTAGFVLSTN